MESIESKAAVLSGFPRYKKGTNSKQVRGRFFEVLVRDALISRLPVPQNWGLAYGQVEGEQTQIDLILYEGKPVNQAPYASARPEVVVIRGQQCRAFLELKNASDEPMGEQIEKLSALAKGLQVPLILVVRYTAKNFLTRRKNLPCNTFCLEDAKDNWNSEEFDSLVAELRKQLQNTDRAALLLK